MLLANVPYVATGHIPLLPAEARDHEPATALDGGDDGLDVFRRVVAAAPAWLAPGGVLLSEITEAQIGPATAAVRAAGLTPEVTHDDDLEATHCRGRAIGSAAGREGPLRGPVAQDRARPPGQSGHPAVAALRRGRRQVRHPHLHRPVHRRATTCRPWCRWTPWCIDRKQKRRRQIDKFVAGYLEAGGLPKDWQQVCPMLRPVLRGGVPAAGVGAPLRRPALPFLHEFVVVDQPDTMTYVAADQLAGWGVSADEVFRAARGNLSGAVLRSVATEPTVVQFMDDGDAYWTSHLLLDGWLARLAEQVGGVPVAFAPERGTLIVAADGSAHLPDLFGQAELAYLTSPRAITPMAYVSDERGRTVPYRAPKGHPMHELRAAGRGRAGDARVRPPGRDPEERGPAGAGRTAHAPGRCGTTACCSPRRTRSGSATRSSPGPRWSPG